MNPMTTTDGQVDQIIGSAYQIIKYVATNMEAIITLAESLDPLVNSMQTAFEALRRTYAESGFVLLKATFKTGAAIGNRNHVLIDDTTGIAYSWGGALPYFVPQNSTLESAGGIGELAWIARDLSSLREELSRPNGVSMVGGAASSTLVDSVAVRVREALRRSYALDGLTLVDGSFEQGATLVSATDVLLYEATGKCYGWSGTFPKVVPSASTPASTGGIFVGAWMSRFDPELQAKVNSGNYAVFTDTLSLPSKNLEIGANVRLKDRGGSLFVVSAGTPDGFSSVAAGSGKRAELQVDETTTVKSFGAPLDGVTDDAPAINAAITFLGQGSKVRYPSGSSAFINSPVNCLVKQHHIGFGCRVKVGPGVTAFSRTTDGYPGKIVFTGFEFEGTSLNGKAVSITNNAPFVKFELCYFTGFGTAVDLSGSYISKFIHCHFFGNDIGLLLRGESHSSNLDTCFFDYNVTAGMCINGTPFGGNLGSNSHNITTISCGFQNSKYGIWAESVYELNLLGTYHEGNTIADLHLGVSDGGAYARSCYHTTIKSWQSSSPCPNGTNIILQHCVGANLEGLAFNAGCSTTKALVSVDGFSDKIVIDYDRISTTTPTATVPFDLAGDAANRVVIRRGGVPLYPLGMPKAMTFGDMAGDVAGVRGGFQPSGRPAMYFEGTGSTLDLVHKTQNIEKFVDGGHNDGVVIDHINDIFRTAYQLGPLLDNAVSNGSPMSRWSEIFAATGTINTSDGREKTEPAQIEDRVLDAWGDVSVIAFKWLEAVASKGSDLARTHFGVVAQDVRDAFIRHGLDGTKYGLLCYDKWERSPEVIDEDGNVLFKEVPAGERWGIRPDQCLFLEAAYQRRNYNRLLKRVEALEAK